MHFIGPVQFVFVQKTMASKVSLHRLTLRSVKTRKNAELPHEVLKVRVANFA
jgi:hypothetical protein